MIDDTRQDQAALYALGQLPPDETADFSVALTVDPELRVLVAELEAAAAALAFAAPVQAPPGDLKARVLETIRREHKIVPMPAAVPRPVGWLPWAVAACFALAAATFWNEARAFRRSTADLQREALELRGRDALAAVKIATLSAKVEAYEKALAIVVFDAQQQRGLIRLERFPRAAEGKDYQLWLLDPAGGAPVSAGLVPVGTDGVARALFQPTRRVAGAQTFAISVEPTGGSPAPTGDVIFAGSY
jgi:anti-sigma-K factor RskA